MIRSEQIRSFLKRFDMTQGELADRVHVTQSTVSRWLRGTLPSIEQQVSLSKLFAEMGFDEAERIWPIYEPPQPTVRPLRSVELVQAFIAGTAAAGTFKAVEDIEADLSDEDNYVVTTRDPDFPQARLIAVRVEGDSMNALKPRPILDGDMLVCVDFDESRARLRDGMVVLVQQTRDDGRLREWSVKQIELYDDRVEFHPRSTNRKHKPIVVKRDLEADDGRTVEVLAIIRRIMNEVPLG